MSLDVNASIIDLRAEDVRRPSVYTSAQGGYPVPGIDLDGLNIYVGHFGRASAEDLRAEAAAYAKLADLAAEMAQWADTKASDLESARAAS